MKGKGVLRKGQTQSSLSRTYVVVFPLCDFPPELHQTQPVAAQPLCSRAERRDGEELVVDAEPRGGQERQVSSTQGSLHGQQQQVHQEQRKSSEEKGKYMLSGDQT